MASQPQDKEMPCVRRPRGKPIPGTQATILHILKTPQRGFEIAIALGSFSDGGLRFL